MNETFSVSSITAGVLVHIIYGAMIVAIRAGRQRLDRTNPAARKLVLALVVVATLAGNIVLRYTTGALFPIFGSALLAIAFFMLWAELRQFWDVGLIGADRTIKGGLNYARSLKMCKNSLSFLGVGQENLQRTPPSFKRR